MKNRKILIIGLISIIIIAIIFSIYMSKEKVCDFLFDLDGTATDGRQDLINHLKEIDDKEERKKQIDFVLEQNIITQEEADSLY